MRRIIESVLLGAMAVAALTACEDGRPRGGERGERAMAAADFGPTAAYERRFVFLGPGQRLPTAIMLDFVALSDSLGMHRGARARLADGMDWVRLLDQGWQMDRMREPWLLVPHGPLALIVGDGGEVTALVVRGDTEVRLEPGPALAEQSPDRGTRLMLRRGRLTVGGELVQGILLDAQLGRTLATTAARPPEAAEEGEAVGATPAGRPGAEALLVDNMGYHLVFASASAGRMAWIHNDGRDDVRRGARIEATAWERLEGGAQVPNTWRVTGGGLEGELAAEVMDGDEVEGVGDVEGIGYAIVAGWVEDQGVRRDVYGMVRHVR